MSKHILQVGQAKIKTNENDMVSLTDIWKAAQVTGQASGKLDPRTWKQRDVGSEAIDSAAKSLNETVSHIYNTARGNNGGREEKQMTDYKSPWWRTFQQIETDRQVNIISSFCALGVLVTLIGFISTSCVDAIVKTVENEEEQRIYKVDYARPAAYRKASPTPDQMEKYHDLLTVMEVNR